MEFPGVDGFGRWGTDLPWDHGRLLCSLHADVSFVPFTGCRCSSLNPRRIISYSPPQWGKSPDRVGPICRFRVHLFDRSGTDRSRYLRAGLGGEVHLGWRRSGRKYGLEGFTPLRPKEPQGQSPNLYSWRGMVNPAKLPEKEFLPPITFIETNEGGRCFCCMWPCLRGILSNDSSVKIVWRQWHQ